MNGRTTHHTAEDAPTTIRWRTHCWAANAVGAAARLGPWAISVATFVLFLEIGPSGSLARVCLRWSVAIVGAGIAFWILDRLMAPLRILTALWRLPLAFTRRPPSRIAASLGHSDDPVLETVVHFFRHDRRSRINAVRVVQLSVEMATRLGVRDTDLDRLIWAAAAHDIGKLDIAKRVLNKPSKPSKKEFAILREHAENGERYVHSFQSWLGDWGHGVDQHHERFDGAGYPNGVAGTQISLAGRIVSIADSVEAMTATRPYKRPMPVSAARHEVVCCAGTQFDPMVVAAFDAIPMNRLRSIVGIMGWLAEVPLVGAVQNLGPSVNQLGTNVATGARMAAGAAAVTIGGTAVAAVMANSAAASTGAGVSNQTPTVHMVTATVASTDAAVSVVTVRSSAFDAPEFHEAFSFDRSEMSHQSMHVPEPGQPTDIVQNLGPPSRTAESNSAVDTKVDIGDALMIERTAPAPTDRTTEIDGAVSIERHP